MRKYNLFLIGFLCILLLGTGCGLIPKAVEFGQKKVPTPPQKTEITHQEEKQAVSIINRDIREAIIASIKENASTNITNPLFDMRPLGESLSFSLGAPLNEYSGSSSNLATQINKNSAILDKKTDQFDKKLAPLEGKKIEGTGIIKIPYFLYLGVVLGGGFLLYQGIKIAINVYSGLNPAFGVGAGVVKGVSSKVISAGFGQVLNGVESLKNHLKTTEQTSFTSDEILKLIQEHQERKQSPEVQKLIKDATAS